MRKHFLYAATLFVLIALLAAACAPAATEAPTEEPPPEAPPAEAPPPEEPEEPAMPEVNCMGAAAGDQLSVMYQWTGAEEEKINEIFKPLVDACGIEIVAEATRDSAVLDTKVKSTPPDVLFWPSTSPLGLYTEQLQDLASVGGNPANYADYWLEIGTVDGEWLAIGAKADIKTIIWYSPVQFDAFGYAVPTTFEELDALVEQMVADGNVPWSMGFESDAATGWTGSDFIQDLLLTQQGPDYVNGLIDGSVAYNDAGVVQAYESYSKWASDATYTIGGSDGTVNTGFLDAIFKTFSDPPEAMMVKQSGFAGGEVKKEFANLEYGVDFDFFAFPGAQGMQGGADYVYAFSDSPATQAMIAYLTSDLGGQVWAEVGFDLSPNAGGQGFYADTQLAKKAEALYAASGFTPDLGDAITGFGEAEWAAIIAVVQGGDIQTALDAAAAVQAEVLAP